MHYQRKLVFSSPIRGSGNPSIVPTIPQVRFETF
jgi:hypothetical protein